jgi:hypothetical protein
MQKLIKEIRYEIVAGSSLKEVLAELEKLHPDGADLKFGNGYVTVVF